MLLRWILKLVGFGFLLGAGRRCGDKEWDEERARRFRQRAAARLHRFADAISQTDGEADPAEGE